MFDIIQSDPPSRSLEQKLADTRFSSKGRGEVPWVPLAHQNQIPLIVYPPLRYPPKISSPDYLRSPVFVAIPVAWTIGSNIFSAGIACGQRKRVHAINKGFKRLTA